jgi:uncharacterized SAM-binding protein YcdF (DUF218 family)
MMSEFLKKLLFFVCAIILFLVLIFGEGCFEIWKYSKIHNNEKTDAILVLGAAVWGNNPSPVFKERINHAINLYKSHVSGKIIFTGGKKFISDKGEANIAKMYAVAHGVPREDIFTEGNSKTTFENIFFSRELIDSLNVKKITLVSDPYHMRRSVLIAKDMGIDAVPSPTPTSKFRSNISKITFLSKESYLLWEYRIER